MLRGRDIFQLMFFNKKSAKQIETSAQDYKLNRSCKEITLRGQKS